MVEKTMNDFASSTALLLALLNPFLIIIYLIDLMQKLEPKVFRSVLIRAGLISAAVFCVFAFLGDAIFSNVIQARFASFQIFGGVVFLLIGLQFVFKGPTALEILRGDSQHLAGAVAMPVMIGPGTISASVIVGEKLDPGLAAASILLAVTVSVLIILILKSIHDYVRTRQEKLIERYIEIAGRITALYVGTVSIEMIMQGLQSWSGQT